MRDFPSGTVTFLFTDVEGSTRLWEEHPAAMPAALARHDALLRTAVAAGAHGAVIPEHRAVGVTPAVVKASAGATERLPIAQVGNLARALEALKAAGLWVVGLDPRAPTPHVEADLTGPLAIVVGGEGRGLRPLVRDGCDFLVRLPMPGPIESLNAAVAGSIMLYEVLRQRAGAAPRVGAAGQEGAGSGEAGPTASR